MKIHAICIGDITMNIHVAMILILIKTTGMIAIVNRTNTNHNNIPIAIGIINYYPHVHFDFDKSTF